MRGTRARGRARRRRTTWLPLGLALLAPAAPAAAAQDGEAGFATILEEDLLLHLYHLAAPELEGRDSPSVGLERAALYIEGRLGELGLTPLGEEGSFRLPFGFHVPVPDPEACSLEFRPAPGEAAVSLRLESDFVPLALCRGQASGPLAFCGFGITDSKERYDDLRRFDVSGSVALVLEGEPRHRRLFEGAEELTEAADVHGKVANLVEAGAVAVLVVRRSPPAPTLAPDGAPLAPPTLGYRATWARWNDGRGIPPQERQQDVPVLEITEEAATRLLGRDVAALAEELDERGKPGSFALEGVEVHVRAGFHEETARVDNVAALVQGTDPALAEEILVLGAHYDHIGVDPWGRIGDGADDNASGSAALLELAEAFATTPPRRSVLFAWFAAEEDGLIGSAEFCDDPPVPRERLVAMFNMDMLGRGAEDEVVVLGCDETPEFEKLLGRAKKLHPAGVKRIHTNKGRDLWKRSDHYSFHKVGIPSLFFYEDYPETKNPDYHTYRDTLDTLNLDKITRTTRLVFNASWLCATDDEAPPRPD